MLAKLITALLLLETRVLAADTFSEDLNIVRLTETLTLMQFNFNFDLTVDDNSLLTRLDYFPAQFYELVKQVPDLTEVEANLVQGRWRDNLIPRVLGF